MTLPYLYTIQDLFLLCRHCHCHCPVPALSLSLHRPCPVPALSLPCPCLVPANMHIYIQYGSGLTSDICKDKIQQACSPHAKSKKRTYNQQKQNKINKHNKRRKRK
jgi:hypothetical protein